MYEVINTRTGVVVSVHKDEAAAHAVVNQARTKAARRLNRPGLHGGINAAEWCDLAVAVDGGNVQCLCQHPARDHRPQCAFCTCPSFMSIEDFEAIQ